MNSKLNSNWIQSGFYLLEEDELHDMRWQKLYQMFIDVETISNKLFLATMRASFDSRWIWSKKFEWWKKVFT